MTFLGHLMTSLLFLFHLETYNGFVILSLLGGVIIEVLQLKFEPAVAILSITISILGSYTSLQLATRLLDQPRKWNTLIISAFCMGLGIWSMHFTSMLSIKINGSVHSYNWFLMLFSFISAIIGSILAYSYIFFCKNSPYRYIVSGLLLGISIAVMHYTGMKAMKDHFMITYKASWFTASIGISMLLAILSMYVFQYFQTKHKFTNPIKLTAAIIMGFAISGIQYTAMMATNLDQLPALHHASAGISQKEIFILVASITIFFLGLILIRSFIEESEHTRQLKIEEAKYQSLFFNNPDGIISFDAAGNFINCNSKFETLLGYSISDLIEKNFLSYIEEEDQKIAWNNFQDALKGKGNECVVKAIHKDGHTRVLKIKNIPISIDHKVEGLYSVIQDITDKYTIAEDLRRTHEKLQSFFQSTSDAINITDLNSMIRYVNPAFETMFGWTKDELIGKKLPIIPSSWRETSHILERKLLNGEHITNVETKLQRKDGMLIDVSLSISPLKNEKGDIEGFVAITRDISERKQFEKTLQENKEKYKLVTENMSDLVSLLNIEGVFEYVSPSYEKILGYPSHVLQGKSAFELIHPNDFDQIMNLFNEFIKTKKAVTARFRYRHSNDYYIITESHTVPLFDEKGNLQHILVTSKDIGEKVKAEQALQESEQKFRLITEHSSDLIRIVDEAGIIQYASPSHKTILGYEPEELEGKSLLLILHPDDIPVVQKRLKQLRHKKKERDSLEYRARTKHGSYIWIESHTTSIFDENGQFLHYIAVARDISEQKAYEEKLEQMAFYDGLTGVANRRFFQEQLVKQIEQAKQNNTRFALVYLDCDRFKWVNDVLGHDVGDELLQHFVTRLKTCLSESDIIGRWGGDEFTVLLSRVQSKEEAARAVQQIIQSMQVPWNIKNYEFIMTSSIGIAFYPEDGQTVEELLSHADQALYQAKTEGRNKFYFYEKTLTEQMQRLILLENHLKNALEQKAFHLVYQPQVQLGTGKLIGVEALLRYTHPTLGAISPMEFIPICERLNMIDKITEWVLQEAARQLKDWKEKGLHIRMAVNISPLNLENKTFIDKLIAMFEKNHCDLHNLELELTETALAKNIEEVSKVLETLRKIGVRIALDDFGSGYSSLVYFKDFPIDKIKVDRSFVKEIPKKERDIAIIDSILLLSKRLGIEVICEGVETEEQASYLQMLGCEYAQGYYFSRPLTKDELENKYITATTK
jgi:diguanylate cyclase (GGDEF)-like protein/PAS domain S-box-containing protein